MMKIREKKDLKRKKKIITSYSLMNSQSFLPDVDKKVRNKLWKYVKKRKMKNIPFHSPMNSQSVLPDVDKKVRYK